MLVASQTMASRSLGPKMRKQIAAHLRAYLLEQRISQAAAAKKLGTSEPTVSRLLSGGRGIGIDVFVKLREKLHLDLNRCIDVPESALTPERTPEPAPIRLAAHRGSTR